MSPEDQRIAIAKSCGWTRITKMELPAAWGWFGLPPNADPMDMREIPDYLNDLNASHEMEKTLTKKQLFEYADMLAWVQDVMVGDIDPIFSTSAQRGEAYLKLKKEWSEILIKL